MVGILIGVLSLLLVTVLVAVLAAGGGVEQVCTEDHVLLNTMKMSGSYSFRRGRGSRPQTAATFHLQDSPER